MTSAWTRTDFALQIPIPWEPRFQIHGVPFIEMWGSGPDHVFHRVCGILDSGCTQTLIGNRTGALLRLPKRGPDDVPIPIRTVGGPVYAVSRRVQFRLEMYERKGIAFVLEVGFVDAIRDNLFGNDLLSFFMIAIDRRYVTLLADAKGRVAE